ncbi:hypothetical protein L1987_21215 [Smallanthus sonchifolius]|uniref:Uncharacterized protein n=1 Tax=Smallanthus sonchifolius TaxID=185202 RepID=A0ACB9IUH5_9ASTR|nr:hypothetical protein L1987_21215 [Smallanthus sonchifolius]
MFQPLSLPDPPNQQSFLFFLFLPPLTPLFFSFIVRVLTPATPWVLPLQFLLRDFVFNLFTQEAGEALRLPFSPISVLASPSLWIFATRVQLGMLKFKEATCWQMKAGEEGGYSMELLDLKGDLL